VINLEAEESEIRMGETRSASLAKKRLDCGGRKNKNIKRVTFRKVSLGEMIGREKKRRALLTSGSIRTTSFEPKKMGGERPVAKKGKKPKRVKLYRACESWKKRRSTGSVSRDPVVRPLTRKRRGKAH